MPSKNGPRGVIEAEDAKGQPVRINVFWRRGSTYLSFGGKDHLVHPSNLKRENGFAMEAGLVFHVRNAAFVPD